MCYIECDINGTVNPAASRSWGTWIPASLCLWLAHLHGAITAPSGLEQEGLRLSESFYSQQLMMPKHSSLHQKKSLTQGVLPRRVLTSGHGAALKQANPRSWCNRTQGGLDIGIPTLTPTRCFVISGLQSRPFLCRIGNGMRA